MRLITERNLLYAYTPMDVHNPHKSKLTLPVTDEINGTTVHDGIWGAEEYMIIDMLSDIGRILTYGNRKPKLNELKQRISKFDSTKVKDQFTDNGVSQEYTAKYVATPYDRIVTRYSFLRNYSPGRLYALIERTSKIRLTCSYRYKILDKTSTFDDASGKTRRTEILSKYPFRPLVPQSLFSFDYCQDTLSYVFKFNSGLGVLFTNNILAAEWEWLPYELYSLSKNAQNLYRKYLLVKKQGTEIRVPVSQIAKTLKLMTSNQTVRRKSIQGYLDELAASGFIKYKVERGYRDFAMAIEKLVSN